MITKQNGFALIVPIVNIAVFVRYENNMINKEEVDELAHRIAETFKQSIDCDIKHNDTLESIYCDTCRIRESLKFSLILYGVGIEPRESLWEAACEIRTLIPKVKNPYLLYRAILKIMKKNSHPRTLEGVDNQALI